uniref:Uncharacterized protein n=1 Tax=Anguilla anguilla TaxID=7936 RepID=A0A0E9RQU1_ANGAN
MFSKPVCICDVKAAVCSVSVAMQQGCPAQLLTEVVCRGRTERDEQTLQLRHSETGKTNQIILLP